MKRIPILLLVISAILSGCSSPPEISGVPSETIVTEAIPATTPAGIYCPDSAAEQSSGGAVRAFPLHRPDSIGFLHMGGDLLLFSGENRTTLTKYSGEDLYVSAAVHLDCSLYPYDPAVQVCESGITYYDEHQNDLVFLDGQLAEIRRIPLPETVSSAPALTADCRKLYYCTDNALRCIDLESGLDRLVKEMYFSSQYVSALHCSDTVIVCTISDEGGTEQLLYVSAETGQMLYETFDDTEVWTLGDVYFATHWDGVYQEYLTGDAEFGPALLEVNTLDSTVFPALEMGSIVLASEDSVNTLLDCYDQRSGRRTASLSLPGTEPVWGLQASAVQQCLWFLRYDPSCGCQVLYRWDPAMTPADGKTSHLSVRYTMETPDLDGIAACRGIADTLCEQYGVQILLWTDATAFQPWDYALVPEYQVPLLREELRQLEEVLALYPPGFLKKAAETTSCGYVQICLVRSILGNQPDSTLEEATGLQYWDDNANAYLSIASRQYLLEQSFCHELFHIIDSRVMTVCKAYDDWESLNPKDFSYDFDYVANQQRDGSKWLEGKNRAFIDTYSMSYPKEDRARIMEYAMMPGNEDLFESEIMQKKLRQLCLGIREAFGLKKSTETLIWEQYLHKPLK